MTNRLNPLQKASEISLEVYDVHASLLQGTAEQYKNIAKKICIIFNIPFDPEALLPAELLTDKNIAISLISMGKQTNYSHASKKTTLAAIYFYLNKHQKENIHKFKHLYPKTHEQIEVCKFQLRFEFTDFDVDFKKK